MIAWYIFFVLLIAFLVYAWVMYRKAQKRKAAIKKQQDNQTPKVG